MAVEFDFSVDVYQSSKVASRYNNRNLQNLILLMLVIILLATTISFHYLSLYSWKTLSHCAGALTKAFRNNSLAFCGYDQPLGTKKCGLIWLCAAAVFSCLPITRAKLLIGRINFLHAGLYGSAACFEISHFMHWIHFSTVNQDIKPP